MSGVFARLRNCVVVKKWKSFKFEQIRKEDLYDSQTDKHASAAGCTCLLDAADALSAKPSSQRRFSKACHRCSSGHGCRLYRLLPRRRYRGCRLGFSGTINLSCTGLPSEAACALTPPSITASGTANQTSVAILVTTTAPTARLRVRPQPYFLAQWMAGAGLLFSLILIGGPNQRRTRGLFLLLLMCSLIIAPACGGGGGGGKQGPPPNPGTPAATSNVVVSATSGSMTNSSGFVLVVK
jgi:hypothetical protein